MFKTFLKISLLLFIVTLASCEETFTEVSFKISNTGGTSGAGKFWGYYCIDGGDDVYFYEEELTQLDDYTYQFTSKDFSDFSNLEIGVYKRDEDATLRLRLYEDDDLVVTSTSDSGDDEAIYVYYEYEEYLDDDE